MGFPELKKTVIRVWDKYVKWDVGSVLVLIEDRASGQSLIQVLESETRIPISKITKLTAIKKQACWQWYYLPF